MHERCGVQEFQSHGGVLRDLRHMSEVARRQQYQHRAHALARPLAYVCQSLAEHAVVVSQSLVEKAYEVAQLRLDRLLYNR